MQSTDHFTRCHNVERFCKLLDRVTDETQRETLLMQLAEEQQSIRRQAIRFRRGLEVSCCEGDQLTVVSSAAIVFGSCDLRG